MLLLNLSVFFHLSHLGRCDECMDRVNEEAERPSSFTVLSYDRKPVERERNAVHARDERSTALSVRAQKCSRKNKGERFLEPSDSVLISRDNFHFRRFHDKFGSVNTSLRDIYLSICSF